MVPSAWNTVEASPQQADILALASACKGGGTSRPGSAAGNDFE